MEWVKALHVVSVIAWMAGLFYLPRLFVYHADSPAGSEKAEIFKVMERRLLRAITTPAMIASWVFGLWLVFGFQAISWTWGWWHLKLGLVIVLSAYHGFLVMHLKAFAHDRNTKSPRYFRLINEVPTILMIGIVIAVIVRPF